MLFKDLNCSAYLELLFFVGYSYKKFIFKVYYIIRKAVERLVREKGFTESGAIHILAEMGSGVLLNTVLPFNELLRGIDNN